MALSTAVRLRSSGSPSADSAVKLRHVQVRLLGDGRHAAKGLGNLAQGNKKVGLVAFIKDIIEVLPCKSLVSAESHALCRHLASACHHQRARVSRKNE